MAAAFVKAPALQAENIVKICQDSKMVKCDVAQSSIRISWENVGHTYPKNRDLETRLKHVDQLFKFPGMGSSKWRSQHDGLPSRGLTVSEVESRHVSM